MPFAGKWMELESIMLRARLRKTNITCFLSYEKSRFKKEDMKVERGLNWKKEGNEQEWGEEKVTGVGE
jgi:hypothetical protein